MKMKLENEKVLVPGDLYNYDNGAFIRRATVQETLASLAASHGVIKVNGTLCYVENERWVESKIESDKREGEP